MRATRPARPRAWSPAPLRYPACVVSTLEAFSFVGSDLSHHRSARASFDVSVRTAVGFEAGGGTRMGEAVRIDPLSWRLTGLDSNWLYTAADLDAAEPLVCPGCGHQAVIDRIPVAAAGISPDTGAAVSTRAIPLRRGPSASEEGTSHPPGLAP